jgi:hypothetical protein
VLLRRAIGADWVERMAAAVDRVLALDAPHAEIAAQAMVSPTATFFYDRLFVKEPGTSAATRWHQDLSYWPVRAERIVTVWMPLDPVDAESGAVAYVRGSHRWPELFAPANFYEDTGDPMERRKDAARAVDPPTRDIDANPSRYDVVTWDAEPGDVILHHPRTIHGAPGNRTTDRRRRAITTRWLGDDAVYQPGAYSFMEGIRALLPPFAAVPGPPSPTPSSPAFGRDEARADTFIRELRMYIACDIYIGKLSILYSVPSFEVHHGKSTGERLSGQPSRRPTYPRDDRQRRPKARCCCVVWTEPRPDQGSRRWETWKSCDGIGGNPSTPRFSRTPCTRVKTSDGAGFAGIKSK